MPVTHWRFSHFGTFSRPVGLVLLASLSSAARSESVQLFQWKNVNIQGMGYVTGLVATTRAGGAYVYMRGQTVPCSAQDMGGLQAIRQNAPLMDS